MDDKLTDSNHLRTHAYNDASRLNARIALQQRFSTNSYPWHRWVFDQMELPDKARILEVGCGQGDFWAENRARIPADAIISLTDLSEGMVMESCKKLRDSIFQYACTDTQQLPFPSGNFDIIIAKHMFYHIPDRPRAYHEIARILKPGGRLYATTNGKEHYGELVELIQGFDKNIVYTGLNLGFNLENGASELEDCFDEVRLLSYQDSLHVTDSAPLAAYIASMTFFSEENFVGKRLKTLTKYLQSIIEHQGSIHITKSVGMFIAHNN